MLWKDKRPKAVDWNRHPVDLVGDLERVYSQFTKAPLVSRRRLHNLWARSLTLNVSRALAEAGVCVHQISYWSTVRMRVGFKVFQFKQRVKRQWSRVG